MKIAKKMMAVDLLFLLLAIETTSFILSPQRTSQIIRRSNNNVNRLPLLNSGFMYDEDADDDDEEEDELPTINDSDIAKFRAFLSNTEDELGDTDDEEEDYYQNEVMLPPQLENESAIDELIQFATGGADKKDETPKEWAKPLLPKDSDDLSSNISNIIKPGVVLVANPMKFCSDFDFLPEAFESFSNKQHEVSPSLLAKFGLTLPPPADLGPDRRADLLPVVLLLERSNFLGSQGFLLNRRTGYLMGDLEQQQQQQQINENTGEVSPPEPKLGAFMIQPLWFGGTSAGVGSGGLDMLHRCDRVKSSKQLADGLYWGGDPAQAQDAMCGDPKKGEKPMSGFDFKFFVQSTRWLPTTLEKEVADGTWFVADVSVQVLFKSRDRMGTRRGKPLWTELMELMGGEYQSIKDELYKAS